MTLDENATLFALLANAVADARIAAFASKYEQKFWRPITALNADADGAVTNGYVAWHPAGSDAFAPSTPRAIARPGRPASRSCAPSSATHLPNGAR